MKLTLSWLKEHLDSEAALAVIAERLTAIGLEVETIADSASALKDFIVGEILSAQKHPQADRLRLCMVNVGRKDDLQIVCGASNARSGIKVVLAEPGTVIPATGEALKVGMIRGVESRAMMLSARELLLGEDHEGIIELKSEAIAGSPAASALAEVGLVSNDPLLDVAITPNRGDAASVFGIARELAASGLGALKGERILPVAGRFASPKSIQLDFFPENQAACPLFAGRLIRGVRNGPSPKWVKERLTKVGLKSISALVDATNLIAHDRGRPLHVFDADKLHGNLFARMAKDGETIHGLDDRFYHLDPQTIVIADEAAPVSIAGIMGGMQSSCTDQTVNVFIESALFDSSSVARTGRKLAITSDARYRFERGVDPQFVLPGLELCTRYILDWCGGEASEVVIAGKLPPAHPPILFDAQMVEKLGGIAVARPTIIAILQGLGFVVEDHGILHVVPPSWRHDVDGAADLVEEVIRIYGPDRVVSTALKRPFAVARPVLTAQQRRTRMARRAIAARGFNETISFSFIGQDQAKLFGGGDAGRRISNPIASDLDSLRPSLLPSLLRAASRNLARGFERLQLFEIGAAFESGVPGQQKNVAAALRTGHPERHWQKGPEILPLFQIKADLMAALEALTGSPMNAPLAQGACAWYHPGRSGTLALGPRVIASFGEIHPKVLAQFDLKIPVSGFEIFLDAIPDAKRKSKARPIFAPAPYQAIERDFAFVVEKPVAAGEILKAARSADRNLIESVRVFDVFEGKSIPEGSKSVAICVRLQPKHATLTEAEIEAVAQKIVANVAKATGAQLRSV